MSLLAGCSKKSEQEYFDAALRLEKQGKLKEAIENYEALIKEYPESKDAPKVLMEIAKIYESKNIPNMSQSDALKKGIEAYRRVVNNYPKSKEAPVSLFMIGFMQSNELHNLDSARFYFHKFLQEFPDHEMASSARSEMENAGKSPEQILRDKLEAQK